MSNNFRYIPFIILILTMSVGCATRSHLKPSKEQFDSNFVDIEVGGIVMEVGGPPKLNLLLKNKYKTALSIEVQFLVPPPSEACVISKKIEPTKISYFRCSLKDVAAETDYPFTVSVYRDEGVSKLVEKKGTKLRFKNKSIERMKKLYALPKYPITFEGIILLKDAGMGTKMLDTIISPFKKKGKLTIDVSELSYSKGGEITTIPFSSIENTEYMNVIGNTTSDRGVLIRHDKKETIFRNSNDWGKSQTDMLRVKMVLDYALDKYKGDL